MESKVCVICNSEENIDNFSTIIVNVNGVILKEVWNVTMIMKINYQINKKDIMNKNRDKLLQKQNER